MKQNEVQIEVSKKKDTIRVSKKDLLQLLAENEHQAKQITELQTRMTEMQEEMRALKATSEPKKLSPEKIEEILKPIRESQPLFPPRSRRGDYID